MKIRNGIQKLIALVGLFLAASLNAEVLNPETFQESEYFCAEIWACDEQGTLLDDFNIPDDPCYPYYQLQCENAQLENRDKENADKLRNALRTIEKLKKKIRDLK